MKNQNKRETNNSRFNHLLVYSWTKFVLTLLISGTGFENNDEVVATIGGVEMMFRSVATNSIYFEVQESPLGDDQLITLTVPGKGFLL